MKKLWKHQEAFLTKNPDRGLLLWEVGLGKSRAACEWIKKRPDMAALVVCPKALIDKWRKDLAEVGAVAHVTSRDTVKILDISKYRALVLDEAQDFASPLFSKARSARATKIYNHVKNHPSTHVLLLTATPVRSTPWNIHTLACYIGRFWPVKEFRDEFEYMSSLFGRMHYELVKDWRLRVRKYVESVADIVLLRDCADVPVQESRVISIPWTKKQEKELGVEYLEPAKEWHERHRRENGAEKLAELKKLVAGYRKVIVVAYYTAQIEEYAREIGRERQVFVLSGATKNQGEVISAAQAADDCVFFLQASMGAGFDADSFSVMIFASQSFKFVDEIQTKGRILRMHNLHANEYIYLLGGKCDRSVYETIQAGHDFHPPSYKE